MNRGFTAHPDGGVGMQFFGVLWLAPIRHATPVSFMRMCSAI